jgi:7-carboxy-7-deazaguanine synthase
MAASPREAIAAAERLRVTEVFLSLQGEAHTVGWPTVFVRLTGCPLRCRWCDTAYAFTGGGWRDIDGLVSEVRGHGVRHVCVTGGEPLAQENCTVLLRRLCDAGLAVSLETSGALPIAAVDRRVQRVVDLKAPGSGETARNDWSNLAELTRHDCVKFVLADRADYEWARETTLTHRLPERAEVLYSPVAGELEPRELASWILADRLDVRFQLQLHKLLWGNEPGR